MNKLEKEEIKELEESYDYINPSIFANPNHIELGIFLLPDINPTEKFILTAIYNFYSFDYFIIRNKKGGIKEIDFFTYENYTYFLSKFLYVPEIEIKKAIINLKKKKMIKINKKGIYLIRKIKNLSYHAYAYGFYWESIR